jgi:hypothetical protein
VNKKNANPVAAKLLTPTNAVVNTKPALVPTVNIMVSNTQSDQSLSPINADHVTVTLTEPLLVKITENHALNQFVINSLNEKNSSTKPNVVPLTNVSTLIAQPTLNVKTFLDTHSFQLAKPANLHEPPETSYTLSPTKLKLLTVVWNTSVSVTLAQPLLPHSVKEKAVN